MCMFGPSGPDPAQTEGGRSMFGSSWSKRGMYESCGV